MNYIYIHVWYQRNRTHASTVIYDLKYLIIKNLREESFVCILMPQPFCILFCKIGLKEQFLKFTCYESRSNYLLQTKDSIFKNHIIKTKQGRLSLASNLFYTTNLILLILFWYMHVCNILIKILHHGGHLCFSNISCFHFTFN